MKMSIQRINKTIRSDKGETLVESIVSLLILAILLLAVTTMSQTALRMTSVSTQNGREIQDQVNFVTVSKSSGSTPAKITFVFSGLDISATHDIILHTDDNIIAFAPPETADEPEEESEP